MVPKELPILEPLVKHSHLVEDLQFLYIVQDQASHQLQVLYLLSLAPNQQRFISIMKTLAP